MGRRGGALEAASVTLTTEERLESLVGDGVTEMTGKGPGASDISS